MLQRAKFEPLGRPDFRKLFVSTVVTKFGYWLTFVALYSLYAFDADVGPLTIGGLGAVSILPKLVGNPVLGVLADRLDRRRIIIVSEVASAGLVLTLAFYESLALAYVVFFLLGVFSAVSGPAHKALIPQLVDDEDVSQANGLITSTRTAAQILGPIVAGVLVTVLRTQTLFVLDAATYFVSAVVVARMASYHVDGDDDATFGEDFLRGLGYMRQSSTLLLLAVFGTLTFATIGVFEAMLPYYIREVLGRDSSTYGFLVSVIAAGSFAASFFIGAYGDVLEEFTSIALVTVANAAGMLLYVFVPTIAGAVVASAATGFATMWIITLAYSKLQRDSDEEFVGRIMGVFGGLTQAGQLAGMVSGSALTAWAGVVDVFAGTAVVTAAFGALLLVRTAPWKDGVAVPE